MTPDSSQSLKTSSPRLVIALWCVLIVVGIWLFIGIVDQFVEDRKNRLLDQLARTGLALEEKHRQNLEQWTVFSRHPDLLNLEELSRHNPSLHKVLKQIFSVQQDHLVYLALVADNGESLRLQRARGNYYRLYETAGAPESKFYSHQAEEKLEHSLLHIVRPLKKPGNRAPLCLVAGIDLTRFFQAELRRVHPGKRVWSWAMNPGGEIISVLSPEQTPLMPSDMTLLDAQKVWADILEGYQGELAHQLQLTSAYKVHTSYYPVRIGEAYFGIGFSAERPFFLGPIYRTSILLSTIFLIALFLAAVLFRKILQQRTQAESEVRQSYKNLYALINSSNDLLFLKDDRCRYLIANRAHAAIFGVPAEELLGRTDFDFLPVEAAQTCWDSDQQALSEGSCSRDEKIGDQMYHVVKHRIEDRDGQPWGIAAVIRDTTDRRALEESLRQARNHLEKRVAERTQELQGVNRSLTEEVQTRKQVQDRLQLINRIYESGLEGIVITDAQANIQEVNPAICRITGYDPDELIGRTPRALKSDRHEPQFYRELWQSILIQGHWEGEIWNRRKSGEIYPEWLRITAVKDAEGEITHFVSLHHDITESKNKEEQIRHLALHDALTGLPNRLLLMDRLHMAIHQADRNGLQLALLAVDLDNFKNVNDGLGHPTGDALLQEIGQRLQECTRQQDTVCRMGGDEFILLLSPVEDRKAAAAAADRILEALKPVFYINNNELHVGASIGVALYPEHADTPDTLIKNADMAMYLAKNKGKDGFQFFTREMHAQVLERIELEHQLRHALAEDQLKVFFQPLIDAETGRALGVEALARWEREDGESISPDQFIPVAEESGLIETVSAQIFDKAFRQARHWQQTYLPDFRLALNVSARQLQGESLCMLLDRLQDRYGVAPQNVELEITETAIMEDMGQTIPLLHQLAKRGYRLSIDDFGTGYSSLNYLKRFPIHKLKIDRSFVRDLPQDQDDASIVEAIISMATSLDLEVLAEGVETREQESYLKNLGCHQFQGYLFSKPISSCELALYLQEHPALFPEDSQSLPRPVAGSSRST